MISKLNSKLTRADEKTYHSLSIQEKELYLEKKYFTPQYWPHLYLTYAPNYKEFGNNAFWRLISDVFLDHYYKGITDPFSKEPVYAAFGLFPAFTSAVFKLPIGSSNTTFTLTHFGHSATRGLGKILPLIVNIDKRNIEGALDKDIKNAIYFTDPALRWIPYSNERLQDNEKTNIYSAEFFVTSVVSGIARTAGSEYANPLAKQAQLIAEALLKNCITTPLGLNIESTVTTLDKLSALGEILIDNTGIKPYIYEIPSFSLSSPTNFRFGSATISTINTYITPTISSIFSKSYDLASQAFSPINAYIAPITNSILGKAYQATKTVLEYTTIPITKYIAPLTPKVFFKDESAKGISLNEAKQKGSMFITFVIIFDITKLVATNIIGSIILQPFSRILGIFAEEGSEYLFSKAKEISGYPSNEHKTIDSLGKDLTYDDEL